MSGFTAVLLYAVWTLLLPLAYAGIRAPMIARPQARRSLGARQAGR